ncbi:P-loop containing nucleoside triphosphate hydrolase protein [Fusarium solani]|uniref:P-loop containing nucleoside triphosphate hydrolase protein n=1 Tax=Fusarium solani TaxID=169388 RepID=A0A9P9JRH6_FUSSL|nr:P-loop containing nucleoside triphosphate hydrolase protein [Fusarium solani]KAH7235092.1 P-loop containing nucleoside triphosphate hydrolase protein [Fusarium solani]
MDASRKASHNLFEVYLRLRPPPSHNTNTERILNVEEAEQDSHATHITLNPPTDRRRAIEKFAFTRVFEEEATQLDVFHCTDIVSFVEGVLAPQGGEGTDAVVATLGVTGSGKTHTILGNKTQRGLTQLTMDVLFRSIGENMVDSHSVYAAQDSLQASDASESALTVASHFFDPPYAESLAASRAGSRAGTPMFGDHSMMSPPPRRNAARTSALPQLPDVSGINVPCDPSAEYVIVISMYEVHNDRIYDLLTPPSKSGATKELRRRALLFKSTELSPDRKVVAGLRKVICTTYAEALTVIETGLQERRVAGTGSNSVSSRSHGFFCFEVKKRTRSRRPGPWEGNRFTIVDLAGSERAREAKTAGATLAEAGKINESLMYLGQCLQTQSEAASSSKPNIVPFRQCKLTELLFSNSFPSSSTTPHAHAPRRNPQRGVMIITADPRGDFNATSQILRYSALAREVTVPRIPSITATILAHPPPKTATRSPSPVHHHTRPFMPPGSGSFRNYTPPMSSDERQTMEIAALEIARLSDETDQLREEVDRQTEARISAEAHLLSMEERMLDMEAAIREDCAAEFEQRLAMEMARWKASMALEQERNEEHWDRKVEILERGLAPDDSDYDKENVLIEDLEEEVERLRHENGILKRELASRSPSKRRPLGERDDFAPAAKTSKTDGVSNLGRKLERMRVSNDTARPAAVTNGSPTKKIRKLGAKRWEDHDELE